MNIFDQNCSFSLNLPIINIHQYETLNNSNYHNNKINQTTPNETPSSNNNIESDLTELSWLTNNLDLFQDNLSAKPRSVNNDSFIQVIKSDLDLDSSFSSSISTSSSSSLNSTNENIENFSQIYDGSIKKMKLNEYFEISSQIKIEIADLQPSKTAIINEQQQVNKPPLTLSCLIFMAIQESKYKCLPVREIYEWIENNFLYYKNAKTGWKSSIRHNLSFSKCFKKMDRLESCKFLTNSNQNLIVSTKLSNYHQRSNYIAGTCWQVNPECKAYLVQTLKKSSFWFKNNKLYPSLTKLMQNYYNNDENFQQANSHHHHHHSHNRTINKVNQIEKVDEGKVSIVDLRMVEVIKNEEKIIDSSSFNSSDNENYLDENEDLVSEDDDVTKAAEILYKNKNNHIFNNNFVVISNINSNNSDLEIEVASTLVRLKSLIEIRS
jgi:hypothetical protein